MKAQGCDGVIILLRLNCDSWFLGKSGAKGRGMRIANCEIGTSPQRTQRIGEQRAKGQRAKNEGLQKALLDTAANISSTLQ